jgi:superfamily II DNA or RNA helicase
VKSLPLYEYIPERISQRGRELFLQGRVTIESATEEDVLAIVLGSREYAVELRRSRGDLIGSCECEYFLSRYEVCKHIWATYVAAVEKGDIDPAQIRDLLTDYDTGAEVVRIRPATASTEPAWASFFSQLQFGAGFDYPQRKDGDFQGEILYVFDSFGGVRDGLACELMGRARKKSGDWKTPRAIAPAQIPLGQLDHGERELLALLTNGAPKYSSYAIAYPISGSAASFLLPRIAATGRMYLRTNRDTFVGPVGFSPGGPWRFEVRVDRDRDNYRLDGFLVRDERQLQIQQPLLIVSDGWFLTRDFVAPFEAVDGASRWLQLLRARGAIEVPTRDRERFAELLAAAPTAPLKVPDELQAVDVAPRPLMRFEREYADSWKVRIFFLYHDNAVLPSATGGVRMGEVVVRRHRDVEERALRRLDVFPFRVSSTDVRHLHDQHISDVVRALSNEGWVIEFGGERAEVDGEMELAVNSGIDWFDLGGGANFGDRYVPLPQLLAAVRRKQSVLALEGGGVAIIPSAWEEQLTSLLEVGTEKEGRLRFTRNQATMVDALLATREVVFDPDFEKLRERLATAESVGAVVEPESFQGELRPYQRAGLAWINLIRETRFGGILADDMGLGKTIQVLAMLEAIRIDPDRERKPTLVVAPRSLMFNWKAEAARFTPELRVLDHHGLERIKGSEHFDEYDLILTTYGTLQRDIAHLANPEFEYVILDEAQAVKNADTQTARAVRTLRARHRLALSGTPIENHLGELWSLFEFINPGMLGTRRAFSRMFGRSAGTEAREKLSRIVRPFVLRRTKENVLPELPKKFEQTLWIDLPGEQRREYEELRDHYRQSLLDKVERDGISKSRMLVLEALLRLRQAASHPALIDKARASEGSGKLDALESELSNVIDSGHKAIVFSQFVSMLDIVADRLDEKGVAYCRIDGSTRDRETQVKRFQEEPDVPLFLISLRAGGVGLNLTAADYVFLLDPWWNPAVEAQAIDRAHRIGQERTVFAYRLVARDTVEEKILELQGAKRDLADSIIRADEENPLAQIDFEDLRLLLS